MRIALDASSILPARTGIGNYTFHLTRELVERAPHVDYRILLNSYRHPLPATGAEFLNAPNVRARRWRIPGPFLWRSWQHLRMPPLELMVGAFDLYHSMSSVVAPHFQGKRVVTVHDLYFERHPEHCDPLGGLYLKATLPKALERADRVIAVSHATCSDLVKFYGLDKEKIDIVYEGIDESYAPIDDAKRLSVFRKELCLPETYILTVGTLEPRKNLIGLFKAYSILKKMYAYPPPLVVVGLRGWKATGIYRSLEELKIEKDVIFTDYVADQHMPFIYAAAKFFVFPSHFEGFGLPLVEAMSCGTPVACSTAGALVEVAGEAAVQFAPDDHDAMAAAMRLLLSSKEKRQSLRKAGLERRHMFRWKRAARKTIKVYEKVLNG